MSWTRYRMLVNLQKWGGGCRDVEASQQHEQTKGRDREQKKKKKTFQRMVRMVTIKVCGCAVEEPRAAESI